MSASACVAKRFLQQVEAAPRGASSTDQRHEDADDVAVDAAQEQDEPALPGGSRRHAWPAPVRLPAPRVRSRARCRASGRGRAPAEPRGLGGKVDEPRPDPASRPAPARRGRPVGSHLFERGQGGRAGDRAAAERPAEAAGRARPSTRRVPVAPASGARRRATCPRRPCQARRRSVPSPGRARCAPGRSAPRRRREAPCSRQISISRAWKSAGSGRKPPSPCTGSTTTQATSARSRASDGLERVVRADAAVGPEPARGRSRARKGRSPPYGSPSASAPSSARPAVEGLVEDDHAEQPGRLARDLHRVLDRLGAPSSRASARLESPGAGPRFAEQPAHVDVRLVHPDREALVQIALGLFLDRGHARGSVAAVRRPRPPAKSMYSRPSTSRPPRRGRARPPSGPSRSRATYRSRAARTRSDVSVPLLHRHAIRTRFNRP